MGHGRKARSEPRKIQQPQHNKAEHKQSHSAGTVHSLCLVFTSALIENGFMISSRRSSPVVYLTKCYRTVKIHT